MNLKKISLSSPAPPSPKSQPTLRVGPAERWGTEHTEETLGLASRWGSQTCGHSFPASFLKDYKIIPNLAPWGLLAR